MIEDKDIDNLKSAKLPLDSFTEEAKKLDSLGDQADEYYDLVS